MNKKLVCKDIDVSHDTIKQYFFKTLFFFIFLILDTDISTDYYSITLEIWLYIQKFLKIYILRKIYSKN